MKIKLLSRGNSAWWLLVGAVVLAVLMSFAVLRYLQERERAIQEQVAEKAQGGPKVMVVVPMRDVPAGTFVARDVFVSRPIDADLVYPDMVKVPEFDNYANRKILHPILRGRPLRVADVESVDRSLAMAIPKGHRAITITSDLTNSFSNMLRPGDLVDLYLLATPTDTSTGTGRTQSRGDVASLFLQEVPILATGRQVYDRKEQEVIRAVDDGVPAPAIEYDTLTLEATSEQAAKIALAQKVGTIRAVLRSHADHTVVTQAPVGAGELFASDTIDQKAALRTVQYIVGGRGDASVTNQEIPPALNALIASRMGLPAAPQANSAQPAAAPAPAAPQSFVLSAPKPTGANGSSQQPSLFFPNAAGTTVR